MSAETANLLKQEIKSLLEAKAGDVFQKYDYDLTQILRPFKWKPIVLLIGNYSSGKSTFINEFLAKQVQRTGQAPTDDSFTVITAPEGTLETEGEITGPTLVNDDKLPFGGLRKYGENFLSHFIMKRVDAEPVQDIAIIDSPGMLDSVTEKDRGYDFLAVIGEFARMADLIVFMFDPHKPGTIKETYKVLRVTLPATTGEDRVKFVMNRIDECESLVDLLRSYGSLCWNLSQMTGRKDIPRIYLTYAKTDNSEIPPEFKIWEPEREELKTALKDAPRLRLHHILQEVDRLTRELILEIEAYEGFKKIFLSRLKSQIKTLSLAGALAFFLGDFFMFLFFGYPDPPFISELLAGNVTPGGLLWPLLWLLMVGAGGTLWMQKITFPRLVNLYIQEPSGLVELNTPYKKDLWTRVRSRVSEKIKSQARRLVLMPHKRYRKKLDSLLNREIQDFYQKIRSK